MSSAPISVFVPRSTPIKAFQLPNTDWIVLSSDVTTWEELTDADFQAKYAPA
jgi:hypothetical protein